MDGSLEPALIQATPDNPRKRAASRPPSISPLEAQQLKKACYEVVYQNINDHVMFQPSPIRSVRPSFALLEYIKETRPRPSYLEKIGNWLDDIYPQDLRKISRSDCFIQDRDLEPIVERSHSAPAIMAGTGTPNRSNGPLVESALYRDCNLALNNILLLDSRTELPPYISALVESLKKGRSSPEPIPQDNDDLYTLEAGASEPKVEEFVRNNIIPPSSSTDKIQRSDRVFVGRAVIPITNPYARISVPVPDLLYGYRFSAFEHDQQMQIATCGNFAFANSEGNTFPFFTVEFKGDGPSSKDWLEKCIDIERRGPLDSMSFSVAMNGTEARLHVSWKDGDFIYMQKIKTFILQRPEEFLEFRRFVRNIIDWRRDDRLECIKSGLDVLVEEAEMAPLKNKLSRPRSKSGGSSIRLKPY
ncbi:hypothetical protein FANTH_10540 [Fusarium anthophilum]|uniref:DUF7924 domain-containing protein n=1 Tax=Fusarium anthophilum TaxID=48485 RepID=A0A8H4Z126_9HYPO|nr:hypothetical protein FANTH_10540 [Fusarium anthophilum]